MLPVQRAVQRPRLRRSWLAVGLAIAMILVGLAARAMTVPASRYIHTHAYEGAQMMKLLREEVRQISLEACLARVELDRLALLRACAAGTARKDCGPPAGQYIMDPCSRYHPTAMSFAPCSFPGSCAR